MSEHFGIADLLRFTLPSIGMMLFMSAYVMVDGFFVSNYCGATALAAVNFVYPIPMILGTVGFMIGTGGSAIVAKTRGEGDDDAANRQFSLLTYVSVIGGIVFTLAGIGFLRPLLTALGADGVMLEDCMTYGIIIVLGVPFTVLQYNFQSFLVTAGKPNLGFAVTVAAGVTNIVLDAVLIVGLGMDVVGAALGTMLGEAVGGIIPLVYFARPNSSFLRLGRAELRWGVIGHACANGSSEMVSNIALSLVSIAYNVQLLAYLGEAGVAAYGVVMYTGMLFMAVFMGYSIGAAPLMSFQYGAQNRVEMRSLFAKGVGIVAISGAAMFVATLLLARPIALVFVGYDAHLVELTVRAFYFFGASLLFMGLSVFGSGLFTSLGNGVVSAVISFVRTMVFEIGAVFLLPLILGPDGIWLSFVVAEVAAVVLSGACVIRFAPRYGYLPQRSDS